MTPRMEDAVIQRRHDEWVAAWNKHDPKLLASFFLPDGDLINPFGRQARGAAEIERLFTEEQNGVMAGSTYAGTIETIRYIGDNDAIVDVNAEIRGLKGPDGKVVPPFKHHVTWIAKKREGKWLAQSARAFAVVQAPAALAA